MNSIRQAVGKGDLPNHHDDVACIQQLLNHRIKQLGLPLLQVDGKVGPATIAAIEKFQRSVVGVHRADGVVSPGMRTWKVLAAGHAFPHAAQHAGDTLATAGMGVRIKDASVNLTEVKPYIIEYLVAVATFYNTPICVTSGKRNSDKQAKVMWDKWKNIAAGELQYIYLEDPKNKKIKDDLNAQFVAAHATPHSAPQYFEAFKSTIAKIGKNISRHLEGEAVQP